MNIVEVQSICKVYPSFCLDKVSFSIEKGRITGFIGRNGAGKTTTIKAMLKLIHCDAGSVCYFGKSVADSEEEIKMRIGYSAGTHNWYPRKKIREIAAVVRKFYPTWDDNAYYKYLHLFALDEEKTPQELSEGMKVKLNLLLALSHRAEILILDEPTSRLDPFSRDELLHIFMTLKKEDVAVLFSTHIISDIEKCADDIVYISRGKIRAAMSGEEFKSRYCAEGECLEDAILRMERGEANA